MKHYVVPTLLEIWFTSSMDAQEPPSLSLSLSMCGCSPEPQSSRRAQHVAIAGNPLRAWVWRDQP